MATAHFSVGGGYPTPRGESITYRVWRISFDVITIPKCCCLHLRLTLFTETCYDVPTKVAYDCKHRLRCAHSRVYQQLQPMVITTVIHNNPTHTSPSDLAEYNQVFDRNVSFPPARTLGNCTLTRNFKVAVMLFIKWNTKFFIELIEWISSPISSTNNGGKQAESSRKVTDAPVRDVKGDSNDISTSKPDSVPPCVSLLPQSRFVERNHFTRWRCTALLSAGETALKGSGISPGGVTRGQLLARFVLAVLSVVEFSVGEIY